MIKGSVTSEAPLIHSFIRGPSVSSEGFIQDDRSGDSQKVLYEGIPTQVSMLYRINPCVGLW